MKKIEVVELTRDGSFFSVQMFETREQANEFIQKFESQYERQGSELMIWK